MFNLVNRAKKKNNKGFSLVELIVVVLIIAIIAVALAPQVMKYVGQGRENVTKNNMASLQSAASAAVAEFQSTDSADPDGTYSVTDKSVVSAISPANTTLAGLINHNAGTNDLDQAYTITIASSGASITVSEGAIGWTE